MKAENLLVDKSEVFECTGIGETYKEAVENAFTHMRNQASRQITDPIISLSTDKVECLHYEEKECEEAFLYFFLKRKRVKIELVLKVYLTIKVLKKKGDSS
ncbi:MAG: DUF4312 family protein [Erysipelotrichaceae bacterium]|jgi:hypothetical protein|nr:DUF4312 family protein [Erysipelotrichaceae bacterium]